MMAWCIDKTLKSEWFLTTDFGKQDCAQNSHKFDLDDVQILDHCSHSVVTRVWDLLCDQNSEHIQTPDINTATP